MTSADAALIKEQLESLGNYNPKWLGEYRRVMSLPLHPSVWGYEDHHILPKNIYQFMPYASFEDCLWNCKRLSLDDHLKAHYLLLGAFRENRHILGCFHAITERALGSSRISIQKLAEQSQTRAKEKGLLDYWTAEYLSKDVKLARRGRGAFPPEVSAEILRMADYTVTLLPINQRRFNVGGRDWLATVTELPKPSVPTSTK